MKKWTESSLGQTIPPIMKIDKKPISNMEEAEEAIKFAKGKELASIKAKNKRRENSIWGSPDKESNSRMNK